MAQEGPEAGSLGSTLDAPRANSALLCQRTALRCRWSFGAFSVSGELDRSSQGFLGLPGLSPPRNSSQWSLSGPSWGTWVVVPGRNPPLGGLSQPDRLSAGSRGSTASRAPGRSRSAVGPDLGQVPTQLPGASTALRRESRKTSTAARPKTASTSTSSWPHAGSDPAEFRDLPWLRARTVEPDGGALPEDRQPVGATGRARPPGVRLVRHLRRFLLERRQDGDPADGKILDDRPEVFEPLRGERDRHGVDAAPGEGPVPDEREARPGPTPPATPMIGVTRLRRAARYAVFMSRTAGCPGATASPRDA